MKTVFGKISQKATLGMLGLLTLGTSANASGTTTTAEVPGIEGFAGLLLSLFNSKLAMVFIALIIIFSLYQAWKNANFAPLIWGIVVAVGIALVVPFAEQLIGIDSSSFFAP